MSLRIRISALALLAATGCGGGDSESRATAAEVHAARLDAVVAAVQQRDGRPLMLNFWATWCPPCVAELPDLAVVGREYAPRGLQVLTVSYDAMVPGVGMDAALEAVRSHLRDAGLELEVLVFAAEDYDEIDRALALPGPVPVTLAFDREGKEVGRTEGETGAAGFRALAEQALGAR